MTFSGLSFEYTRTRLTQTFELPTIPTYMSPGPPEATGEPSTIRREDSRGQEVGSTALAPHMRLSSRIHSWKTGTGMSELSRTYVFMSGEQRGVVGDVPYPDSRQATPDRHPEGLK